MVSKEEEHKKALMQEEIDIIKKMSKIKHKIAVMSGKGGVGKSTIAVNLAAAFAKKGYKTGIMDVDVHGPNVPKMLGLEGKSLKFSDDGIIPAKTGVIKQFFAEVIWGDLDVLIIDNPPGTGDEPLTILQTIPLDGVVLITTPQSVVQEDVIKSVNLVKSLKISIIGIIENMSGFVCPECKGSGAKMAEKMDVPFLGSLPLDVETSAASDIGTPILIKEPESEISVKILKIADKIESKIMK